jgi:hypothetical protein
VADARVTVLSRVYVVGTDEWRRMLGEGELHGDCKQEVKIYPAGHENEHGLYFPHAPGVSLARLQILDHYCTLHPPPSFPVSVSPCTSFSCFSAYRRSTRSESEVHLTHRILTRSTSTGYQLSTYVDSVFQRRYCGSRCSIVAGKGFAAWMVV